MILTAPPIVMITIYCILQGVLSIVSQPKRYILQCVYELYEKQTTTHWEELEERINRLVFIGQ